jgi:hypothetical protein
MFMVMAVSMGMGVLVPMVMLVPMGSLLLSVNRYLHMRAHDAAGFCRDGDKFHPRQTQSVHGMQKVCPLVLIQQFIQRGHEHVPRRPHAALQIQSFHKIPSI